jgi:hypothetical protein
VAMLFIQLLHQFSRAKLKFAGALLPTIKPLDKRPAWMREDRIMLEQLSKSRYWVAD